MTGHVLDQLVFVERRKFRESTKNAVFVLCAVAIAGAFWWFRAISFGIEGPVGDHHGWQWRRVSAVLSLIVSISTRGINAQNWNVY